MKKNQLPQSIDQIPEVILHPATIKHLEKGHPWITQDTFTEKFPESFLIKYSKGNERIIFINDRTHPKIKARLWCKIKSNSKLNGFEEEIEIRLKKSFKKRNKNFERDNYYLSFAEADLLPGLFIQRLGSNILIQIQCEFWNKFQQKIIEVIKTTFGPSVKIWWQDRGRDKNYPKLCTELEPKKEAYHEIIQEFGVKLEVTLGESYDQGIYTDMSSVRKKLIPYLKGESFLNLYCYTGAFSLLALKLGLSKVTSVDISGKYLKQLEKNLILNNFNLQNHTSIESNTLTVLDCLLKNGQKYDFLVCDPPSASSDGKNLTRAFDTYPELLSKIYKLLNYNGLALLALNTHQIGLKKFEDMIIRNSPKNMIILERFKLSDDCPTLPYFPEGNYLKIILLQRNG